MTKKKRVFISYGREHSLDFANRLYFALEKKGIDAWFDFANIPKGDDFQKRIDDGIESADNFIFVMSPHALKSTYCKKELKTAVKYNKRIIPISHIEVLDDDPVWSELHKATIKKLNWVLFREKLDTTKPQTQWEDIDDFDNSFKELLQVLNRDAAYITKHTDILTAALSWDRKRRLQHHLLAGPDLFEASSWLSTEFIAPAQTPCLPTNLQCEFICESIKNANNLMTDVFMISASWEDPYRDFIRLLLARNKITTWRYASDIQVGMEESDLIKEGIEGADNIIFLISEKSIASGKCLDELALALEYNKRIIPVSIQKIGSKSALPDALASLSDIDFTAIDLGEQANPMDMQRHKQVNVLVNEIEHDKEYFQRHKQLLTRALKWERLDKNDSFLIRGYNLSEAQTWLQEGLTRSKYRPNTYHQEFLRASEAKVGILQSEVFISYSQKNADFSRKLNLKLQTFGKNTWFDQESLVGASNFEEEIFKGIASSENFVFIISPQSVASPFCAEEVNYASKQNKRFIPILLEETPVENIPVELRSIQWVDFKNKTFETAFGRLIQAINIDRAYVKQHTRILQGALEWEEKGKSKDRLIRGEELSTAELWLDDAIENKREPAVTATQRAFIEASELLKIAEEKKELSIRNLRRILRISAFAVLAATILVLAYQFRQSRAKELEASEKAGLNYAFAAREVLNNDHAPERALSIIKEAINIINNESVFKLLPYFRDISMSLNYIDMRHEAAVKGVDLSSDITNRQLISFTQNEVKIWNLDGDLIHTISSEANISQAGFSPDKKNIYIITNNRVINLIDLKTIKSQDENDYAKISIDTDKIVRKISANDNITSYEFFNDGERLLVVYESIAARMWTSKGYFAGAFNHNGFINGGVISEDENFLLTYSNDNTARFWSLRKSDSEKFLSLLRNHNAPIVKADLAIDNSKAITLDKNGKAVVWDMTNVRTPTLITTYDEIDQIAFTKDPNLLLIKRKNQKVQLEDLKGEFFSELLTYKQFNTGIDSVLLSNGKDQILTYAQNGSAALWKLNGQLVFEVDIFENNISADLVKLSPEGYFLLKTDSTGTITLWDTQSGNELASFKAYRDRISDVVFFPDHKQLVAASSDNSAKRWKFKDNLFDEMVAEHTTASNILKQSINSWLDSMDAGSLKMAAQDKIRIGLLDDFDKIINSADSAELYTYANYFKKEAENNPDAALKEDNYAKAFLLFQKINDSIAFRTIFSEVASADILFEQKAIDTLSFNTFFTPDGLIEQLYLAQYISQKWSKLEPVARIPAYNYIYTLYNIVLDELDEYEGDISEERKLMIRRRASDNCNSLAYYYLLSGKIDNAIDFAEIGMKIDSTYEWISTKLALAHLYNASFDKAAPLLKKMKGKKFGIDVYEEEMQRYIVTIDSAYKAQGKRDKALPLSLKEIIKVHENQIENNQYELLNSFLPEQ